MLEREGNEREIQTLSQHRKKDKNILNPSSGHFARFGAGSTTLHLYFILCVLALALSSALSFTDHRTEIAFASQAIAPNWPISSALLLLGSSSSRTLYLLKSSSKEKDLKGELECSTDSGF